MPKTQAHKAVENPVSRGRHEHACLLCKHAQREEIEREWIDWGHTNRIARDYKLSRDTVYRHAHAVGLFDKRTRNIRKALERMIEQAETVEVNAAAVVSAVQAYAKINTAGQWVERSERVNLNELFERMTREELDTYAREGKLPDWFTGAVGATVVESQPAENKG